jgi:hypothetical protein
MAGRDLAVDAVLVVCAIAGQRSDRTINPVEQGTDLRAVPIEPAILPRSSPQPSKATGLARMRACRARKSVLAPEAWPAGHMVIVEQPEALVVALAGLD